MNRLVPEILATIHQKSFSAPFIGVTGGKGGVGKTTVAINIAVALQDKGYRVALVDADVEAPNAALLLGLPCEEQEDVMRMIPLFETQCTSCGDCVRACRKNALFLPTGGRPILMGECNGCEACLTVCPAAAVTRGEMAVGKTFRTKREGLTLFAGEIIPGFEESAFVVKSLRERVFREAKEFDIILIDTAPGTHCNVINSLMGVDTAFAVTEPTPLGAHDLSLILRLFDYIGVKGSVVLNRSDLPGSRERIEEIAGSHEAEVSCEIPMDELLVKSYVEGVPVVRAFPDAVSAVRFIKTADDIERGFLK